MNEYEQDEPYKDICKHQSLRNVNNDTVKWLQKRPHLLYKKDGMYIPTEAIETKKIVTMDTKENRFVKFMLISIVKRLDKFLEVYKSSTFKGNVDQKFIDSILAVKKKINIRLNNSYLKNISSQYKEASLSLVFTMASGYK